jgi:hypothetical protein
MATRHERGTANVTRSRSLFSCFFQGFVLCRTVTTRSLAMRAAPRESTNSCSPSPMRRNVERPIEMMARSVTREDETLAPLTKTPFRLPRSSIT